MERNIFSATAAFVSECWSNILGYDIKYIGGRRRHWSKSVFWMIALLMSLVGCSIMSYDTYKKWKLSPMIVSFDENSTPVWKIPFPAVTICPIAKASKDDVDFGKIYQQLELMKTHNKTIDDVLSIKDRRKFEAIAQICNPQSDQIDMRNVLEPEDIVSTLINMTRWRGDVFRSCKWKNENINCSDFTNVILTDEGICLSFNIMDSGELLRYEIFF